MGFVVRCLVRCLVWCVVAALVMLGVVLGFVGGPGLVPHQEAPGVAVLVMLEVVLGFVGGPGLVPHQEAPGGMLQRPDCSSEVSGVAPSESGGVVVWAASRSFASADADPVTMAIASGLVRVGAGVGGLRFGSFFASS
jgi:hypothetical protein